MLPAGTAIERALPEMIAVAQAVARNPAGNSFQTGVGFEAPGTSPAGRAAAGAMLSVAGNRADYFFANNSGSGLSLERIIDPGQE